MREYDLKTQRIIGADVPLDPTQFPLEQFLQAFHQIAAVRSDVALVLAGLRSKGETFSVWNFIEQNGLSERIEFLPYFEACRYFPVKKSDCAIWINRDTLASDLTAKALITKLDDGNEKPKSALFFTSFHPEKQEGNSFVMRQWLSHLREAGYSVHIVYYKCDFAMVTSAMASRARAQYDLYQEIDVTSRLAGKNRNGLNVHVDDWCGGEAVRAVRALESRYHYDIAFVHYAFMSAVFEALPPMSKKILLTHDAFANRNQRMLEAGYLQSGWVSLTAEGETLACLRADVVVAVQEEEAKYFSRLVDGKSEVRIVAPVIPTTMNVMPSRTGQNPMRIGYFGSSNWINEANLAAFLECWLEDEDLRGESEIIIAGGVCDSFAQRVKNGEQILARAAPKMLGRMDDLSAFFQTCDVIVNPERGGSGIKIKTLEALAAGSAIVTTLAGSVGIGSTSRYHRARDAAEIVDILGQLADDNSLIEEAKKESVQAYQRYAEINNGALEDLLGPPSKRTSARIHSRVANSIDNRNPTASNFVRGYSGQTSEKRKSRFFSNIKKFPWKAAKRATDLIEKFTR